MRKVKVLFLPLALISLLLFVPVLWTMPASAQGQKGSYVDTIRFIHREDENLALQEVRSGTLDLYYFRIPLEAANDADNDPKLRVYDRLAGSIGFLVNPAPSNDANNLNPFQFKEIRFAMNYLIDREFIVNEVLKGYGSPMVDPFGIYSPEYLTVIDTVESFGFRYNPRLAENMISQSLIHAGATKDAGGKWTYNGNPITVKILIRQDDISRKYMGEEVASKLESAGFMVEKEYGDLNKANTVVYGSDPKELQWHLYTEGFAGTSVFVRYNPVVPAQMYAPWYGRLPGGQNPDFWNYQNTTLDQLTQSILFFNFTSENERNQLVREAVQAGIQESVRIFVAQKTDPYVASSKIDGLVNDFGAGITSKYSMLNARSTDGNNTLDIGVKQIHQGSWNGIAGLQDTYSRDIYTLISDSGTFRDPYTGDIIPMRAEWTNVTTRGPVGTITLPKDVLTWDPIMHEWIGAAPTDNATSKVSFRPLYSNWHNGIPMDKFDLIYTQYFFVEWGTCLDGQEDATCDPEYSSQAQVAIPYNKGFKILESGEIESYIDIWHYDEKEIADSGIFWASEPWEITAATERLVTSGKVAYSRSQASSMEVPWFDPIVPDHAKMVREELQKMKNERFVPSPLKNFLTSDDAITRYDASIKWIDEHNHSVISNGPFYLDSYNIAGRIITVKAFNDSSYPFGVGYWSKYEKPRLADIVTMNIPSHITIANTPVPRSVLIGQPLTMTLKINVDGNPSNDASVDYFVLDSGGKVIIVGKANPTSTDLGEFKIQLSSEETSLLSTGPNQFKIFASSHYAFRPDISERTIIALPARS